MMKVIHMEIDGCKDCPFAYQDETNISCSHKDVEYEEIMSYDEFCRGQSVKKKYGRDFPPFCPLPDGADE